MRLAVFTNQFPTPVSTFFARDMRGLIEAGIDLDVFPLYPLDPALWVYVPDILNEKILPRHRIHYLSLAQCIRDARRWHSGRIALFLKDTLVISGSALSYGFEPLAKSCYAVLKAWSWAGRYRHQFDQVLAYWGNYAGTCAYVFHRLIGKRIPFSIFLHAGTDLYRTPIFMREKLLYADTILTCSEFNQNFIRSHYEDIVSLMPSKIYVHRHGLELAEFAFQKNGRELNRIVAVGRLEKEKGFDYLIKAVQQLKHANTSVTLHIVGDGTQRQYLKKLAARLHVNDIVTFTGWLSPSEARAAIREASILVHPSPDLGDGVPNVIKESMALGTPVIASAIAGIPELLGNGGLGVLVPAQDVGALAQAIRGLLYDADTKEAYSKAARHYSEECFDMWRNGKRLAEVFYSMERAYRAKAG